MIHHEHESLDVLDVGSTLTKPSRLEMELYTVGLANQPPAFLNEPPFPYLERRPGVLWVEDYGFRRFAARTQDRMLNDATYGNGLKQSFDSQSNTVALSLESDDLDSCWFGLCRLMAFTAFNWLTPHNAVGQRITDLTGMSEDDSERWRLRVSVPNVTPHFLVFRLALLELAANLQANQPVSTTTFARRCGPLEGQGLISQSSSCSLAHRSSYEDPTYVMVQIQELAETIPAHELHAEREAIMHQRQSAIRLREEAVGVAELLALLRGHDPAIVRSIATVLQTAVTAEETRHVLQVQAQARLRDFLIAGGKDLALTSASDISLPMPPKTIASESATSSSTYLKT